MYRPPSPSPSPSPSQGRFTAPYQPTRYPSYGSRLEGCMSKRSPQGSDSAGEGGRPRLPSFAQSFGQIPAPPLRSSTSFSTPTPASASSRRPLPPIATLFASPSGSAGDSPSYTAASGGTHSTSSLGRAQGRKVFYSQQQQQQYQQLPTPDPPSPYELASELGAPPSGPFSRPPLPRAQSTTGAFPSSSLTTQRPPTCSYPSRPPLPSDRRLVSTPAPSSSSSFFSSSSGRLVYGQPPSLPTSSSLPLHLLRSSPSFPSLSSFSTAAAEPSSLTSASSSALPLPKLFPCPTCSLRFARKNDLVRHERIHSGETPFYCGNCGMGFKRSDARKRHEKRGEC